VTVDGLTLFASPVPDVLARRALAQPSAEQPAVREDGGQRAPLGLARRGRGPLRRTPPGWP